MFAQQEWALPEMAGLAQLVVVEPDEGRDCLLHRGQLHQRHLTVLREELECLQREKSVRGSELCAAYKLCEVQLCIYARRCA